ncbi:MAG: TonB-dependent receptor, partial [Holophagales bacterium]|nr:TonB-dependent receptor [Holophagales bacterium]
MNLDPVVRGLNETQVAAMVDGTRTYAAGPGRMDSGLSHLGRHDVESLRLVKGPYALTWGSGALAAIDLVTRRPDFGSGWSTHVGASWDDNGERSDTFLNLRGGGESWRIYLGATRRDGGDYEAGDGSIVAGDYESTDTRWRFGYRPSDSLLLELSGGYQEQADIDYPGRLLDANYFYTRSHALELDWSGSGGIQRAYAQVYSNRKDHLMNNDEKPTGRDMPGRIPPFALRVDLPTESNTTGGRLRLDLAGTRSASWSVGADASRSEQTASRTISRRSNGLVLFEDIVWPDAEIQDLGIWAQALWGLDRVRLGATVRLDDVSAEAGEVSPFFRDTVLVGGTSLDQDETLWSAAASLTADLAPGWTLQAGLGRAVRTATALERYSDRFPSTRFQLAAEFVGNPQLDPETSTQLDLGFRYTRGGTQVRLEGFYREIDDYITVVADPSLPKRLPLSPPTVFRYVNGEASFHGMELSIDHRPYPRFSWHGDLAWLEGTDDTLDEPAL